MTKRVGRAVRLLIAALGGLIILLSALSLIPTDIGLVRVWDFPRPQLAALSFIIILALLALGTWRKRWGVFLLVSLVAALSYHAIRIAPYTPIVPTQVVATGTDLELHADCVSILTSNVHQSNRDSQAILGLIARYDPDVTLLLETDSWWREAVHSAAERYSNVHMEIRSNKYGLMFMTRLEGPVEIRHLVEADKPSIKAMLQLASGQDFDFYGLHPEPPLIGQPSDERDAELITVAKEIRERATPAIVAGDLNDVAWSHTTRLFRQISRMLDPRIGRGLYASFHADHQLLRWPIDHLFHSEEFLLSRLEVLPHIGSDHFPVFGRFCFAPRAEARNKEADQASPTDHEEAREAIEEGMR